MLMSSRDLVESADYDPSRDEVLHDSKGTPITAEYIEDAAREAESGYEPDQLIVRGRPSLSGEA